MGEIATSPNPSDKQKSPSPKLVGMIVLVMFLWATCFPFITLGIKDAPHLTFATFRAVLSGSALLALALVLKRPMPRGTSVWALIVAIGLGATTFGFFGMFHAAEFVAPGVATVIANTQPLMAAVLAYLVLGETLKARAKVGLAIGFLGVAIIALPEIQAEQGSSYQMGVAYIVLAALGITVSNVLIKKLGARADLLAAMGWQMIIGSVPLGALALATEDVTSVVWSDRFIISLMVLSLGGTALVYWLWSKILQRIELTRANAFSFLMPVFGVAMSVIIFGESFGWMEIGGIIVCLAGIHLVNSSPTVSSRL